MSIDIIVWRHEFLLAVWLDATVHIKLKQNMTTKNYLIIQVVYSHVLMEPYLIKIRGRSKYIDLLSIILGFALSQSQGY